MQHLSDGGFGRLLRSHRHLALGWLLLAASFEAVNAQSADLFFEGVLLVEPAPPAEVIVPVAAGNAMGGGLPSWSYTTTPDGRDGWAQQFASAGRRAKPSRLQEAERRPSTCRRTVVSPAIRT